MPDAFAAVISECRVKPPMEKTVANSTAAGSTMNIESGNPVHVAQRDVLPRQMRGSDTSRGCR